MFSSATSAVSERETTRGALDLYGFLFSFLRSAWGFFLRFFIFALSPEQIINSTHSAT